MTYDFNTSSINILVSLNNVNKNKIKTKTKTEICVKQNKLENLWCLYMNWIDEILWR
jgi:hypothetical protein